MICCGVPRTLPFGTGTVEHTVDDIAESARRFCFERERDLEERIFTLIQMIRVCPFVSRGRHHRVRPFDRRCQAGVGPARLGRRAFARRVPLAHGLSNHGLCGMTSRFCQTVRNCAVFPDSGRERHAGKRQTADRALRARGPPPPGPAIQIGQDADVHKPALRQKQA